MLKTRTLAMLGLVAALLLSCAQPYPVTPVTEGGCTVYPSGMVVCADPPPPLPQPPVTQP